jgi:hypothetical protein
MQLTGDVLLQLEMPKTATGVIAVAPYSSAEELKAGTGLRPNEPGAAGSLASVIGREFLVPDDPAWEPQDLLRAAVDLSGGRRFRRKRAAYWRWQDEFLRNTIIIDRQALNEAIEEMRELIEDEKAEARKSGIKLGLGLACAIGAASAGIYLDPHSMVALGGAFLSVGGWVTDHFPGGVGTPPPAAICITAQRELGWPMSDTPVIIAF